jgi:alpha-ribazole phosphatase
MSHITTSFWWVRHAPVAHGGRIYGQTDLSCDCSETALFTGLAEKLPHSAIWATSNLRRTHETAAAIVRAGLPGPQPIPGPEALMIPELAEQDFGEWQGLTYEELQESRAGDFHRFWHAPAHEIPPDGESFVAVIERVSRAIHQLVETHCGRDIENCSLTRIDRIDGPGMGHGWRVVRVNQPPR